MRRDEFAAATELACLLIENHCGPNRHILDAARVPGSGVGTVEGWRGTVVYRAEIVDPSWFNWPALPVAMADTIVPDFPLANKSSNQSYAGNDL